MKGDVTAIADLRQADADDKLFPVEDVHSLRRTWESIANEEGISELDQHVLSNHSFGAHNVNATYISQHIGHLAKCAEKIDAGITRRIKTTTQPRNRKQRHLRSVACNNVSSCRSRRRPRIQNRKLPLGAWRFGLIPVIWNGCRIIVRAQRMPPTKPVSAAPASDFERMPRYTNPVIASDSSFQSCSTTTSQHPCSVRRAARSLKSHSTQTSANCGSTTFMSVTLSRLTDR
jgi:hypothetical protein